MIVAEAAPVGVAERVAAAVVAVAEQVAVVEAVEVVEAVAVVVVVVEEPPDHQIRVAPLRLVAVVVAAVAGSEVAVRASLRAHTP